MSGWLPNPELAMSTMGVAMNFNYIIFMLPLGLAAATSTRVANELGGNQPGRAKTAMMVRASWVVRNIHHCCNNAPVAAWWCVSVP